MVNVVPSPFMETFVGFSLLFLLFFHIGEGYGCLLIDWAKDLGGDSWSWGSIEARDLGIYFVFLSMVSDLEVFCQITGIVLVGQVWSGSSV